MSSPHLEILMRERRQMLASKGLSQVKCGNALPISLFGPLGVLGLARRGQPIECQVEALCYSLDL